MAVTFFFLTFHNPCDYFQLKIYLYLFRTPLSMATSQAGENYSLNEQNFTSDSLTHVDNKHRPVDVLDTLRVLIEEGGSDPMAVDFYLMTALHKHKGTREQYHYLLHQEEVYTDTGHRTSAGWKMSLFQTLHWHRNIEFSHMAYELEKQIYQSLKCSIRAQKMRAPIVSAIETFQLASYVFLTAIGNGLIYDKDLIPPILNAFKQLIADGVDPVDMLNNGVSLLSLDPKEMMGWYFHKNWLVYHKNSITLHTPQDFKPGINKILAVSLNYWIKTLREAGVDIVTYLRKEEKLAIRREKRGDGWIQIYGYSSWWFLPDLHFHYDQNPENCFVSAKYRFWRDEAHKKGKQTPGAWSEDKSDISDYMEGFDSSCDSNDSEDSDISGDLEESDGSCDSDDSEDPEGLEDSDDLDMSDNHT